MPSPVAHGLAGLALIGLAQHLSGQNAPAMSRGRFVVLAGLLACAASAPDFDFVPGVIVGNPDWLHRGRSHSLFAAVVVGAVAYGLLRLAHSKNAGFISLLTGLAYASHVVLDMFSPDPIRFNGVPVFWPLSGRHFILPGSVFLPISRDPGSGNFLLSLWSLHNLHAVLREGLIMGAVVILIRMAGQHARSGRRDPGRTPDLTRHVDSES